MRVLSKIGITLLVIIFSLYIWGKVYSIDKPLKNLTSLSDTIRIYNDLKYLTQTCNDRSYKNVQLNWAANYIKSEFLKLGPDVEEQVYETRGLEFKNIIFSIGPKDAERIIIGAHYDNYGEQEGADDNASGVAGLLELARLLQHQQLKYRIDFVAYSTEEPPFFSTEGMGSYVHAKSLYDNNIKVKGMICLEMIGFYKEEKHSQEYPLGILKWFYGNKGNYITVVQKYGNGKFGRQIKRAMLRDQVIRTKSFKSPKWLPGVDFSDHRNYWKFGYSAVMITNTAFYRNKNYHTQGDTLETLSIGKIGLVVDEVCRAVIGINN